MRICDFGFARSMPKIKDNFYSFQKVKLSLKKEDMFNEENSEDQEILKKKLIL